MTNREMPNREMRRQQNKLRGGGRTPAGGARTPGNLATIAGGGRRGGGAATGTARTSFFKDIFSELRKVQWPTRQEAWNLTLVVILVSVVVGLALGGLDSAFGWLIQNTVLR